MIKFEISPLGGFDLDKTKLERRACLVREQTNLKKKNVQQSSPLLYSIDIRPARNSRLTQRETNHYIARCASVLAWCYLAERLPAQLVVDHFAQHQRFAVCCLYPDNKDSIKKIAHGLPRMIKKYIVISNVNATEFFCKSVNLQNNMVNKKFPKQLSETSLASLIFPGYY